MTKVHNDMIVSCNFLLFSAAPHSSVGSVADLRTGGGWFDPRLSQYSFRGLTISIATGFITLSPLSIVSNNGYVGKQPVAWKQCCAEYWLKELKKSMDRCTDRCDITKILLKPALNLIQSIKSCHSLGR